MACGWAFELGYWHGYPAGRPSAFHIPAIRRSVCTSKCTIEVPFVNDNRISLCDRDACTGCEACKSICPENCISMLPDREGFLYPEIDEAKCIRCERCRKICPVLSSGPSAFERKESPKTYACWINDDLIRFQSSSGGVFSAIALQVLDSGGIVFGASYDESMHLRHMSVESRNELDLLRRSKYVQSELGDAFRQAKDCLHRGRRVFFVGAPCQIAGLNAYLGADNQNLLTADFICHGVPSPGVFSEYVKYIEGVYGRRLKEINFRDKRRGWPNSLFAIAKFDTGEEVMLSGRKNSFRYGFCTNLLLRKSCYNCAFKKLPRWGDFTIGDFAIVQDKYSNDAHKGISCLLLNSPRGEGYVELLKDRTFFFEETLAEAERGNRHLRHSASTPAGREKFFEDFNTVPFACLTERYLTPPLLARIRGFIKCHLNLQTVLFIQKVTRWKNTG